MSENNVRVHVVKEPDRANWSMRYRDPITGKLVKKTSGEPVEKDARKKAAQWESAINEGRYRRPLKITWDEFRGRCDEEKLAPLSVGTQIAATSALNHFERVINPKRLKSVTSSVMSRFGAELRKEGMKDTTLDAHLGHLQAAFSWAVSVGILARMPEMHRPKRVKGRKLMRGRPITGEEFERMLEKIPETRPQDCEVWIRYLNGLWLSGLRLVESLTLSWDEDSPFCVDLSGKHPRFRIYAEAEKGNRDRLLPMTPDFAEWLLETPEEDRHGRVFTILGLETRQPITDKRVSKIIMKFGEKAGVVVNRETKKVKEMVEKKVDGKVKKVPTGRLVEKEVTKYASAHDLRRAFGTRWAKKVMPAVLKLLMRHSSIETTMGYYVDIDADDVASDLWRTHAKSAQEGTVLGTAGQNRPSNDEKAPADESTETLS